MTEQRHHIQRHILKQLIEHASCRYVELRPSGVEANQFVYHLKQLMGESLIQKCDDGSYALTERGRAYADKFDPATFAVRWDIQPRSVLFLAVHDGAGQWLLERRDKQPTIGMVGFISCDLVLGETITETARQYFTTRYKQEITFQYAGSGSVTLRSGDDIESYVIFQLLIAETDKTILPANVNSAWYSLSDLAADDVLPSTRPLLSNAATGGQTTFLELAYDLAAVKARYNSGMTKIIVLCGGNSPERQVSLRSGAAVAAALAQAGYDIEVLDPSHQLPQYETDLRAADVVFPVLHGVGGEDGSMQKWLEDRHITFVGADSISSALCFDKWTYKQRLIEAGLPVPAGEMVESAALAASKLTGKPFVLKPFDGGSSVDTFIVREPAGFDPATVAGAFGRSPRMLVEQLIEGTEITVGVLLDEALPVIEIIPPKNGEFDYDNKYNGKTQELCPPRSVEPAVQHQAQDLALNIHRLTGVRGFSRTDMIVDTSGKLWVLETNTIPGMTDQSLLPKAALQAGYTMVELCQKLVTSATRIT